jgi:hypothetical protein
MKKYVILLVIFSSLSIASSSQALFPYTLGAVSRIGLEETAVMVRAELEENGFRIAGEYSPASDTGRRVIVITSDELLQAAAESGGLTGFAAALRIGLTFRSGNVQISYTTPGYWLNAYYRDDYEKVESILEPVSGRLEQVMQESGNYRGTGFGSEEGLKAGELRSYRYMVGMPRFNNTVRLRAFSSHAEAIDKVESSLIRGIEDVRKVYSVDIPGTETRLYGFALEGEKGEEYFLPVIDVSEPKHTAFLPYEFLVIGKEVHMLHGRYRIALSFPDLSMGTFTRIMSTPGDIKDLLNRIVE